MFKLSLSLILLSSTFLYADASEDDRGNASGTIDSYADDDDNKGNNSGTLKAGKEGVKQDKPPRIGNFSLPTSQQPSGLFAFGGNVIDEGEVQLFVFADAFSGKQRTITDVIPSVLYGVTDEFSILFNFPVTPIMRNDRFESSGLEDFYTQIEYAFYNKKTSNYIDQATIVVNITVPTGSIHKNPTTGFGSPSFFIGGTYYRMYPDWFVFCGDGAILTTSNKGRKIGNQYLYQFGFGRNICSPVGTIYAWMVELDGQYSQLNRLKGHYEHNSGGHFLYVTPSLWISTQQYLVQFGFSLPITQNLFGRQHKIDYAFNLNLGWSFY